MPSRKVLKTKSAPGPSDLLSNLPSDIIAKVLGLLPIRDAIRTCLLSRQWRNTWLSIPDLSFEDSSPGFADKFAGFVYRVLLLHQGPVRKFDVFAFSTPQFSDISQWLTFASQKGVENIYLEFGSYIRAPSSLFRCGKLTALSLIFFNRLELPVDFNGFMSLKSLTLEFVTISIGSLEKLISGCPLLESLQLHESYTEVLKIHAPHLKFLFLEGKFEGFLLEKTPLLEEISVTITYDVTEHSRTLIRFIDRFLCSRSLSASSISPRNCYRQHWNVSKDPKTIAVSHSHLWFIKLRINFEDQAEVRLLIQLMSTSPVLEELEIIGTRHGVLPEGPDGLYSGFWSEAYILGCELSRLNKVTMTASGSSNETEFMKFMLLNSPALETMVVTLSSNLKGAITKMLVDLLKCRRASTNAEVVYCDT